MRIMNDGKSGIGRKRQDYQEHEMKMLGVLAMTMMTSMLTITLHSTLYLTQKH